MQKDKDNKRKKIIDFIIVIAVLVVSVAGATYAYFALSASDTNTISGTVGGVSLVLTVTKELPTTTPSNMIPQLESTLEEAVSDEYNCIDDNNNVVCQVYKATLVNNGSISAIVDGSIVFDNISTLPNLKWKRINSITDFGEYDSYTATTEDYIFEDDKTLLPGETIDYYFVIWVDEIGLLQEDEGTFTATINFNAASGGVSSSVTNSKIATTFMSDLYNSGDDSDYITANIGGDTSNPTVSLNSAQGIMLDNNGEYRYYGGSPNNYVSFNGELWRIISSSKVFSSESDTTGSQRVRIIRADSIGNHSWNYNADFSNSNNNWENATLSATLNGGYYNRVSVVCYIAVSGIDVLGASTCDYENGEVKGLSSEARNLIDDALWYLGGGSDSDLYADDFYNLEHGTTVSSAGYPYRWTGKVGIMYPSDYTYATDLSVCIKNGSNYSSDVTNCAGEDWLLNNSNSQWLISPSSYINNAYGLGSSGAIFNYTGSNVIYASGVRPVVVLKSNVKISGGKGTDQEPYQLSL